MRSPPRSATAACRCWRDAPEGGGLPVWFYGLAGAVVVLDQTTKLLVERAFRLGESVAILPGFFNLTYVLNPGAAFGLFAGAAAAFRGPFFITISLLAVVLISYYHARYARGRPLAVVGLGLILGGAAGNLIDRLRVGMVVDFLDFHVGGYHWPAFNVADSGITIGVGLLLLQMLRERKDDGQGATGAP
ncbi:MAG: lipoprotein signal peptidase [candidate division NC10 bacterium]|nr:lipoprotein signal peptidase [candidate division NC10 bacterium]